MSNINGKSKWLKINRIIEIIIKIRPTLKNVTHQPSNGENIITEEIKIAPIINQNILVGTICFIRLNKLENVLCNITVLPRIM